MMFWRAGKYRRVPTQVTGGVMAKKNQRIVVLAVACVFLMPGALFSQNQLSGLTSTAITMQQAVDLARTKNPTLLSAQQNLFSVKAQEIQAGLRVNPDFNASGSNVTLGAQANNPYDYNVGISRLFERGQKRRWRLDSARSTTAQTDAQYHNQEQQTILAVRQAFTNFVLAKAAKKLADDNLNDFKHEVDIGHERLKAG